MRSDLTLPGLLGALVFAVSLSAGGALLVGLATEVAIRLSMPCASFAGATPADHRPPGTTP